MILTWSPLLNMINERLDLLADWVKISFLSLHLRLKKNVFCIPILMMEEHEKESTDLLLGWKVGSGDLFQMQLFYFQSKNPFCILKCFSSQEICESLEFPLKGFSNLFKRYTLFYKSKLRSWKNSSKKFLIQFKASNQGLWMVIWRA